MEAETITARRSRLAVHEAGHSVTASLSACVTKITRVVIETIVLEDGSSTTGGRMDFESYSSRPHDLWEQVVIALAGLAAERLMKGYFLTAISEGDLAVAMQFVHKILTNEDVSAHSCPWNIEMSSDDAYVFLCCIKHATPSPPQPREADILYLCYVRAQQLIREHQGKLEVLAEKLEKNGHVDAEEIHDILGH